MKWTDEAEAAVRNVPFFVRKRVRERVERDTAAAGRDRVTLIDVQSTRQRFLSGMSAEIKGYRLEACFGSGGCPNAVASSAVLVTRLETALVETDMLTLLRERVGPDLKFHHEFTVTLADCPNACSQPQIRDVGLLAARMPAFGEAPCSGCAECVSACREGAVTLGYGDDRPSVDTAKCLGCDHCVRACATGHLVSGPVLWRVLLGGKLGRHPRLGMELPGMYDDDAVVALVRACLNFWQEHCLAGERFSERFSPEDIPALRALHGFKDNKNRAKFPAT